MRRNGGGEPARGGRSRRAAPIAALLGSAALHAGVFGALVSLQRPTGHGRAPAQAASLLLPFETGSGPAGGAGLSRARPGPQPPPASAEAPARRPAGPAPVAEGVEVSQREDDPPAEPPPAAPAESAAEPAAAETGAHDVPSEQFLQGLMARSAALGVGGPEPAGQGGEGCPDRIEGTWQARRYHTGHRRWGVFSLQIERTGRALEGTIKLRAWNGGPDDRRPPRCAPGRWNHTVRMRAQGRLEGDRFRFDALSYTRRSHCMDPGFGYNLDHFRGTLEGDVLDAVNNDGGIEINTPYRFERIACE